MYPDTQLYIDGAWSAAASGRTAPVVNPATGEVIGKFAFAERADLDRALAAAVANAVWHATGIRVRDLPIRMEDLIAPA